MNNNLNTPENAGNVYNPAARLAEYQQYSMNQPYPASGQPEQMSQPYPSSSQFGGQVQTMMQDTASQNNVWAQNSYNNGMYNKNYMNNNYGGRYSSQKVTLNSFQPEDILLIDGIVEFSHITRFYEGEELDDYNRRSNSRYPQTKPFISITISDPKVSALCRTPLTAEYIDSVSYISKTSGKKMMNLKTLSANNYNRRRFPRLSVNLADYDQGMANLADLEMKEGHEPAKGSRVTVILKVYGSNGNNSGSIQEVILHDNPPRFYSRANTSRTESQLEALGITRSANPYTQEPTFVQAPETMEEDFHHAGYSSQNQTNTQMPNNGYRNGYQNQQQYGQQSQQTGYGQNQMSQPMPNNSGYSNGYQNQNNQQYQPDYTNYQQGNQGGYGSNQSGPYNPNNDPNRRY